MSLPLQPLWEQLHRWGLDRWAAELPSIVDRCIADDHRGNWTGMLSTIDRWQLDQSRLDQSRLSGGAPAVATWAINNDAVVVEPAFQASPRQTERLFSILKSIGPWRKGPFELAGIRIDAEWRSNLKWDRFGDVVDWNGRLVLDIGSGNGYYGWRMIDAGAAYVLGVDPTPRSVIQFELMRRMIPMPANHFILPIADTDLPGTTSFFDAVVSAGVLYHHASPIEHLRTIRGSMNVDAVAIIETITIDSADAEVLVPVDRYAQMPNVWMIPSTPMLLRWMRRTGFCDLQVVDRTVTTPDEQRSTDWMTQRSLESGLDPHDARKTVEGYPAPVRTIIRARRKR